MDVKEIISSGVLELYVMGLASQEEVHNVEAWASQYPEVAAEINAIASGLESYARANALEPGASVKDKILARINDGPVKQVITRDNGNMGSAKVYSISPAWKYAAAAGILLLIGSLIFNYTYYKKYSDANNDLQLAQTELQQEKESAKIMDTAIRVMGNMNARQVAVKSIDSTADMGAKIYWMTNTQDVYIDPSNLPKAPQGKQYEFWAIVDGAPVNGGVITTEINGKIVHIQKMKSFGKAQAFAISLEDAGPAKTKPAVVKAMGSI